ncbi:ferrochelatase [Marinihelvus fidelis]|uniref:Ferrochelatase n=1 Tax=Marinihelvus fidelis TaxID=2613842 RepID=A0A5N0TED8_9GAMM|nr:ferrochelatase [Marinihelvus fidelis]KAA9133350.1 ferrochelatase [Marinihelvus fidelis]
MSDQPRPTGHPDIRHGKVGVLLVNLGTPDGCDTASVRRYLREFLSDPRVVERPRWLWYPVLYGIILTFRPKRSAEAYAKVWDRERDESPLRTYSRDQAARLGERLAGLDEVEVDWAMRYGNPAIEARLLVLREKGCDRVVVVPLYPQYSATTTASVCDEVFRVLSAMRWMPAVRVAPPWHDAPVYIDALARSLEAGLAALDFEPQKVVASYHGIPKRYFDAGDPYYCHCMKTSRLLEARLGWPGGRLVTAFQSTFGPEEWLTPATDETVKGWAANGTDRVAIFNPGFVADCIETLEEIDIALREDFFAAGGRAFAHVPCLNASDEGMDVIETIVRRELCGWTHTDASHTLSS